MTNSQLAAALSELGTLLELQGESGFRANSYHVASRAIDQLPEELSARTTTGPIANLTPAMMEKVETLLQTGRLPQLDGIESAAIDDHVIEIAGQRLKRLRRR